MARSTGIGLPITRTDISGAKVAISLARRTDLGSITTRTATRQAKPPSAMENTKGLVSPIMKTGTSDPVEPIQSMSANPTMAKRRVRFTITKRMAKRCGSSSPTKKGAAVRNRMNTRSVSVMFAVRSGVWHGRIPVRSAVLK